MWERRTDKKEVIFKTYHIHKNLPKFSSCKDQKTTDQKPNFTHCFTCLECSEKYIGKTDPNIITCLHEHSSRVDKPLHIHASNCDIFGNITNIMQLIYFNIPLLPLKIKEHISNTVLNNISIVEFYNNYYFWKLFMSKSFNLRLIRVSKHHVNLFCLNDLNFIGKLIWKFFNYYILSVLIASLFQEKVYMYVTNIFLAYFKTWWWRNKVTQVLQILLFLFVFLYWNFKKLFYETWFFALFFKVVQYWDTKNLESEEYDHFQDR